MVAQVHITLVSIEEERLHTLQTQTEQRYVGDRFGGVVITSTHLFVPVGASQVQRGVAMVIKRIQTASFHNVE